MAFVVQKELDLVPRQGRGKARIKRARRLRELYSQLEMHLLHEDFGGLMATLSGRRERLDPVRCAGDCSFPGDGRVSPLMHHKFLVFCHVVERQEGAEGPRFEVRPHEVWTGSFNMTNNAARSFENVVAIQNRRIARAYYEEWMQIEALSEPLAWNSYESSPEWYIDP